VDGWQTQPDIDPGERRYRKVGARRDTLFAEILIFAVNLGALHLRGISDRKTWMQNRLFMRGLLHSQIRYFGGSFSSARNESRASFVESRRVGGVGSASRFLC